MIDTFSSFPYIGHIFWIRSWELQWDSTERDSHIHRKMKLISEVVFSISYIISGFWWLFSMGLLPDTLNCGLRMRRECRERFPRHRLQRKPLVTDPGMHHGTCVTHVPWCMPRSLTCVDRKNVPGIPDACAIGNFTYLARGPLQTLYHHCMLSQIEQG